MRLQDPTPVQSLEDRTIRFDIDLPPLPPHAVAAVMLELAPEPSDAGGAA